MASSRRFLIDPYHVARTVAHSRRARPAAWSVGLFTMFVSQLVIPYATVRAQIMPRGRGIELGDGPTESINLGANGTGPTVTKIGTGTPRLKVKASEATGCGPGSHCDVTTKPLNLTRTPSEKELRMAGQFGGALSPLFPADVPVWQKRFDAQLKQAGIPNGLNEKVDPPAVARDPISRAVNEKKRQVERLKKMNLEFGQAMQQWNKHEYRAAATKLQAYMEEYPESPWAGEAALHLGCDAKYNGRFNEAQTRFQEILDNTSADPADPSWEIHQKAKLRWADLDIALGRFNDASDKLANMLRTEKDWRRKTWERYWFRSVHSQKKDARVLRACGTKALGFVMASLGQKERADALQRMTPTREAGFSLAELSQLSAKNGLPMEGIKASVADLASMPLPFIIHYDFGDAKRTQVRKARGSLWQNPAKVAAAKANGKVLFPAPALMKVTPASLKHKAKVDSVFKASEEAGHFLVVKEVDTKTSRVHLFDPQEGRSYTLSFSQLDSEWSGAGLRVAKAPASKVKSGAKALPRLSMAEMKKFVGGCCGVARAGGGLGPNGPGTAQMVHQLPVSIKSHLT